MSSGWDEAALSVESTWLLENVESEHTDGSVLPGQTWFAESWGEDAREATEEENVGKWLANIGQGAATGAATGAVAGPWGALIGGLLGGGLGAVQTAVAQPQPVPRPAAPAPRPAPAPPVAAPSSARRAPAPVSRPVASQVRPSIHQTIRTQPARTVTAPASPSTPIAAVTPQLVDQLTALIPVVAALAAQVGQLSQAAGEEFEAPEELGALVDVGLVDDWGESGEDPGEEAGPGATAEADGEGAITEDRATAGDDIEDWSEAQEQTTDEEVVEP